MAETSEIKLPSLPAKHENFIQYVTAHQTRPLRELLEPYNQYDAEMRKVFAQDPNHTAAKLPNVVPVFGGHESSVTVRARDPKNEDAMERERYIMALNPDDRKPSGSPAIVESLKEFSTNFNIFAESSLADMDWSNVVAAGSAVVTSLLAVPEKHGGSKRALRTYYHEQLAPASDVDLFLYGLTEEQAVEKIKQIERSIRDAILSETTTIRTKNAITIASQYPTRHVQIVLRIYKSISEILTGFDVDCSCAAFDGKQVYASPRALVAYMSQINTIDLTRRSPSYENRLSKYAHRGFEVYWPLLDRSKIDPTIFERSFGRIEGLARLLVLEKLPSSTDRDQYLDKRRAERGRPALNRWRVNSRMLKGNIKNNHEDEVAEWVEADDVSDYHTFTIPYGPKFNARRIEKLLYTKDLLLNAEWNRPKEREVNLHRHPAFFGRVEDVIHDCCGFCPKPGTVEEKEVAEEENKIYISGDIGFIQDDPGRQAIGSFNPLTAEDWTDMAYVGNTARLCQAIVDGDAEYVGSWLDQEGNDPNTRDYTGRTPLQLAVSTSTPDIVQQLINCGARLVARLVDGKTALHLAAMRGNVEMVSMLLRKSEANEAEEDRKDVRKKARAAAEMDTDPPKNGDDGPADSADNESDVDMVDAEEASEDEAMDATTERSMVKVRSPAQVENKALNDDDDDEPDVYDINVLAWDSAVSPLHLAIVKGHCDVVRCLVQQFGADVLLPVKLYGTWDRSAQGAILTMVLALQLDTDKAKEMANTLIELGTTTAQADVNKHTVLEYCVATRPDILPDLMEADAVGVGRAINYPTVSGNHWNGTLMTPLLTAIRAKDSSSALQLLAKGAKAHIDRGAYIKASDQGETGGAYMRFGPAQNGYERLVEQPIVTAIRCELPDIAIKLIEDHGEDVNVLSKAGASNLLDDNYARQSRKGTTVLDETISMLEGLSKWTESTDEEYPPLALEDDSAYLAPYSEGSYARWYAEKQLKAAKSSYNEQLKAYEERSKESKNPKGMDEKNSAIQKLLEGYQRLQTVLEERGAKTFATLYPDIDKEYHPQPGYRRFHWKPEKPKPFKVKFNFMRPQMLDEAADRYVKLFEAAWAGELDTVKELTLIPWTSSEGEKQPPLTIATQDELGMSPFSIAILHSNFQLATAIMQIAQAQFVPEDKETNERYKLDSGDGDEDDSDGSDAGSEDIRIEKEIVDDKFTIDTVGEVSTLVKSRTKPLDMMLSASWAAWDFVRERSSSNPPIGIQPRFKALARRSEPQRSIDLIMFALYNNDQDLLMYLLSLGEEYTKAGARKDDEDAKRFFDLDPTTFSVALEVDRPHLTAEIIKRSGVGIPLHRLIKKSGVEVKNKPKYYQGLSVYGKKRQDWADAGRKVTHEPIENHRPPLLEAAKHNALNTVEWFLSDAPMRCYREFAAANADDKRIKWLSEAAGGFEATVSRFLNARSKLAIHCCIMGKPGRQNRELLRWLIETLPESINAKSKDGITPLHIAFRNRRHQEAQMLIEAGADQTQRDKLGQNIVHHLLSQATPATDVEVVRKMFELVDQRLVQSLCTERSSVQPGAMTPLARWITHRTGDNVNTIKEEYKDQVLRVILQYSQGAELSMLNGEGHSPLHVCVRDSDFRTGRTIIEQDQTLILRENATGRTAFEMAEDSVVGGIVAGAPALPSDNEANFEKARARRFGLVSSWHTNLLQRDAASFLEDALQDHRSNLDKLWDLLRTTKAQLGEQGQARRRLVSLNEANEVARRLAATSSGKLAAAVSVSADNEEELDNNEDQADADEVQAWLPLSGREVELNSTQTL